MTALMVLLGLGLVAGLMSLGEDDAEPVAEDEDRPPERVLTDADDRVYDESYRADVARTLEDYVAEGELSQDEADEILAGAFDSGPFDLLTAGGADSVLGGAGDDTIGAGTGDDTVHGGAGDDAIQLGEGDDTYGVDPRSGNFDDDVRPFPLSNEFGIDEAVLEGGDDIVRGGAGDDNIADGFGRNNLIGHQGDDLLIAVDQDGLSPDTVSGGYGDDAIYVDEGDTVETGQGSDRVTVELAAQPADGYSVVQISDFVAGQDRVELAGWDGLWPTGGAPDPVTVADSADGSGAVISVDGVPIVEVIGGQGMTRADVAVAV